MEDNNIFMYAGFIDSPSDYRGAIGVYDYFWSLDPTIRDKLISSWKKTIEYLEDRHNEMYDLFDLENEYGSVAIFADEEPIEVRAAPDNVIQFPKL